MPIHLRIAALVDEMKHSALGNAGAHAIVARLKPIVHVLVIRPDSYARLARRKARTL